MNENKEKRNLIPDEDDNSVSAWSNFLEENKNQLERAKNLIQRAENILNEGNLVGAEEVGSQALEELQALSANVEEGLEVIQKRRTFDLYDIIKDMEALDSDICLVRNEFWLNRTGLLIKLNLKDKLLQELPEWNKLMKRNLLVKDYSKLARKQNEFIDLSLSAEPVEPKIVSLLISGYFLSRAVDFCDYYMPEESTKEAKRHLATLSNLLKEDSSLLPIAIDLIDSYYYTVCRSLDNTREGIVISDFIENILLTQDLDEKTTKQMQKILVNGPADILIYSIGPWKRYLCEGDEIRAMEVAEQLVENYPYFINEDIAFKFLSIPLITAYYLAANGETEKALYHLNKAFEIIKESSADFSHRELVELMLLISKAYKELGDFSNLSELSQLTLEHLGSLKPKRKHSSTDTTKRNQLKAYINLATAQKGLGDLNSSQKSFEKIGNILGRRSLSRIMYPEDSDEVEEILENGASNLKVKTPINPKLLTEDYLKAAKEVHSILNSKVDKYDELLF